MKKCQKDYIINTYSDRGFLGKLHFPKDIVEFDIDLFKQLIESGVKLIENRKEINPQIIYLTFQLYEIVNSLRYEIIYQDTKLSISKEQFECFYDELLSMIYGIIECDLSSLEKFRKL